MFKLTQQNSKPEAIAARLDTELDALEAHVAEHGKLFSDPQLPVRLACIAVAWIILFTAAATLDVPLSAAIATLIFVPVMVFPELIMILLSRRQQNTLEHSWRQWRSLEVIRRLRRKLAHAKTRPRAG